MQERPTISTTRLVLRPFTLADAPEVQRLAGERDVASTTLHIPHPYEDGMAEQWISRHQEVFETGKRIDVAVTLRLTKALLGAISLSLHHSDVNAEVGYWIGKPFWNQGYCTEAAQAVVRYGFEQLGLHRIYAHHMTRNPASGCVMLKIGMSHEGCLRQHIHKWGIFEDVNVYGILRGD